MQVPESNKEVTAILAQSPPGDPSSGPPGMRGIRSASPQRLLSPQSHGEHRGAQRKNGGFLCAPLCLRGASRGHASLRWWCSGDGRDRRPGCRETDFSWRTSGRRRVTGEKGKPAAGWGGRLGRGVPQPATGNRVSLYRFEPEDRRPSSSYLQTLSSREGRVRNCHSGRACIQGEWLTPLRCEEIRSGPRQGCHEPR